MTNRENKGGVSAINGEKFPQNKRRKRAFLSICAVFLVILIFLAGWFGAYFSLGENARSLLWAVDKLEKEYYRELDEEDIYAALYSALSPDAYSYYMTAEEYEEVNDTRLGKSEGIGVTLTLLEGENYPRISKIVGNSPVFYAGIKLGVYLLAYGEDETSLTSLGRDTASFINFVDQTAGEFYLRCGFEEDGTDAQNFLVQKKEYASSYCEYRDSESAFFPCGENTLALVEKTEGALSFLDGNTAYIRLTSFNGNCVQEMYDCLSKMRERGRSNLIFDLRGNGGGYLNDMMSIASMMMKNAQKGAKNLVASAKYRSGKVERFVVSGTSYEQFFLETSTVNVLMDERSASASEALVGALVDYGTVSYSNIWVRENSTASRPYAHTYGKGIMQSTYVDSWGNAMKLTTAEIFWPQGKSIHGVGITAQDGANAVVAPLIAGKEDVFLTQVAAQTCAI